MVAVAYDRAASGFAQAGEWDKAASAWESSAAAMAQSTTPEWANVAWEYAGNAWGQNGNPGKAAQDWEAAANGWNQLAQGNVDKYTVYRDAAFGYWSAAGYWRLKGVASSATADQTNAQ